MATGILAFSSKRINMSSEELQKIRKSLEDMGHQIARYRARIEELEELLTHEKLLRSGLAETGERYRELLDSIGDIFWEVDAEGVITFCSPSVKAILGFDAEDLVGRKFYENSPDRDRLKAEAVSYFQKGKPYLGYEYSLYNRSGRIVWLELNGEAVRDGDGNVIAYRGLSREVTSRRKTKESLEREKNYARHLIEKAQNGISVCDIARKTIGVTFTIWNDRMKEITGYSMEEVNEKGLLQCFFRDVRSRRRAEARLRRFLKLRDVANEEWSIFTREGKQIYVYVGPYIIAEKADSVHVLISLVDITREKELQVKLCQAERLSSVGRMVAGLAHEINNPLTGIVGFAQMIASRPNLDPELQEALAMIKSESERTRKIVQDLLVFARKHKPEKTPCLVNDIIADVMKLNEGAFRRGAIQVLLNLEEKIPTTVLANRVQLQQVFVNIMSNAIDALAGQERGKGEIKIKSEWLRKKSWNVLQVSVHDNGCGIREREIPHIFDPFYTTKPVGEGTGLGLSISYGIIKEHRGRIFARSQEGKGTTFYVELPLTMKRMRDEPGEPRKASPSGKDFTGKKVLIIDDEKVVLKLLATFLKARGLSVDQANGGAEGLDKLLKGDYDFILSDFAMPGLDGRMIFEEVSKRAPHLLPKLLFMTGDIKESTRLFFEDRKIPCMLKPFDLNTIREFLEIYL
jgi:PAS domain S-box-containing protein